VSHNKFTISALSAEKRKKKKEKRNINFPGFANIYFQFLTLSLENILAMSVSETLT